MSKRVKQREKIVAVSPLHLTKLLLLLPSSFSLELVKERKKEASSLSQMEESERERRGDAPPTSLLFPKGGKGGRKERFFRDTVADEKEEDDGVIPKGRGGFFPFIAKETSEKGGNCLSPSPNPTRAA